MTSGRTATGNELRRVLGLRQAVAIGVGGTIGGGIFVLVGSAAGLAGPGALVAFGLAFLLALLIAVPYAELASRYPEAGGGYAFARIVLGRTWGFLMGWGFWGAYVFVSGYVTLGFGGYLQALTGVPTIAGAGGLVMLILLINIVGLRMSGAAQTAVVVLAIAGLLGFAGLGLPAVDTARFSPWLPNGIQGVLAATLLAFLAFGGFDMVAAAGEEIERPQRNLPLAILLTLAIVLGVYLLVALVAIGTLPWESLGRSPAPLADAATASLGPTGGRLMATVAVLTTAATANAVLVVTSRISFAMARDGLLPRPLARTSRGTGTPRVAVTVNAALILLVTLTQSVDMATAVGGFLYVAHFMPPLAAVAVLHRRGGPPPPFRTPRPALLLLPAFVACATLLVFSGPAGVLGGLGWLAAGLALHRIALLRGQR